MPRKLWWFFFSLQKHAYNGYNPLISAMTFSFCKRRKRERYFSSGILCSPLQALRRSIPSSSSDQFLTIEFNTRDTSSHPLLLLLFHHILILLFILTPLILGDTAPDKPPRDSQNKHKPKDVDGLQGEKQGKCYYLRDPAFVLLGFPVEFEGAHGAEGGQDGPEDV